MSWKKRISIWIVFSLSMQCLVLFYIDHYFLATDSKMVTEKIDENKSDKLKNIDITLPANAENILVSYGAKYLCYYENKELKIADGKNGNVKNIEAEDGSEISFYKWLPDRNRMFLVEKSDDESSKLVVYSYDVEKGEKVKIGKLAYTGTNDEVEDIQVSILTGVIYIKVLNEGGSSSIYRIDRDYRSDRDEEMTKIDTIPKSVSNMALARHEDNLVYEGLVYNKMYSTTLEEPINIKGVEKLTLIGTDDEDNVYLGELKDNLVSKIYYGKTLENTENWKVIDLQKPSKKNDLFVTSLGKVYQNDVMKAVIKDVSSGTETSYKGKLLQLYTKGIVSLVNDKEVSFVLFK
ncbi:hypothetical protein KPL35_02065 [Clostridium sp. CF011]|uniref:hypothetical protein n=1 Tax=Clostridium sp. CF011 TaxID=2843318 RepID=UPI001C0D0AAF|nr:hypothetical protein [Clostridium sp. CF011]MBU3090860.1 hypothetical protein [Clostridium sp. CF011]WAG69633.1 hypothetical protein LL036_16925 [Clostridium sp. CF011]